MPFFQLLYFICISLLASSFTPDQTFFDAYGLKLASNDILLVEALASQSAFAVRLAPFNYSLTCTVPYNDTNEYVYAVAVQRQISSNDTIRFVFIGVTLDTDVPFIGSLTYTGITGNAYVASIKQTRKPVFPCTGWQKNNYQIHYFEQFAANESNGIIDDDFVVVAVAPTGRFAYAFSKNFLITYDLRTNNITIQQGNATWPNSSFLPHAVDISRDRMFVVLGYVGDSSTQYTPCAYLLNISSSTLKVLDTWVYTAPSNTSWQATLNNWDADIYLSKYEMSVSMDANYTRVLLGIQIVNTIVLLNINRTTYRFVLSPSTLSNGKAIGMGKAVGWLDTNLIVVLVNTYSFSYVWVSSQIVIYNVSIQNSFVVTAVLPNIQQPLVSALGPALISLVATGNGSVMILDSDGDYYILLPSPIGSFSDSSARSSSTTTPCIGGTFNAQSNVLPCSLCASGTTTSGLTGQSSCVSCNHDDFCPLGSAFGNINLSSPLLENINQVYAYPVSPQSTRFDNILIQNMFVIHSVKSSHCFLVSPLFWALIVVLFGVTVWLFMLFLKYCVKDPRGQKTRQRIKSILKKTDLIGEGELVIGGLFSFAIVVLLIFAYTFSYGYFRRYPLEILTSPATFACDPNLSNTQFHSGLMMIGIPPTEEQDPIFDLLDEQPFTLTINFLDTLFRCTDVSATQIKDTNLPMPISSCDDSTSSLSVSLPLPSHGINIQLALADINTIGGLRMQLTGPAATNVSADLETAYTLAELNFAQTFYVSNRILAQQPSCVLQLSKVINQTYPLIEGEQTQYNAIWLPTISASLDQMFVNENEHLYASSSNTVLSIVINETPYYMLNTQKPITDEDELIFSNLLFTIVCLELFGLGFLLFKLIIFPLAAHITKHCCGKTNKDGLHKKETDAPLPLNNRL